MKRLAVVEDNPDNRLLIQAMLGDTYEISEYASGQEALDGVRLTPPDVMLLDISLPEMDGVEVLRRLRAAKDTAGLPVIAVTAHAMSGDRERFLAHGFDGYVTKPIVDADVLTAAIEQLVRRN